MKEYLFEWKELVEKSVNIVATSRVEAHRKWLEGDYNYEEVDINNEDSAGDTITIDQESYYANSGDKVKYG